MRGATLLGWLLLTACAGAADVMPSRPSVHETKAHSAGISSSFRRWLRDGKGGHDGRAQESTQHLYGGRNDVTRELMMTDDRSLQGPTRSLLGKPWHFFLSYLPINRPMKYPAYAKYWLPSQRILPKWYVAKTKSQILFDKMQRRFIPHSFKNARATYYGTHPAAGDSIDLGSCGYSYIHKGEACGNSCLDVAAISDVNPEYPGSCGRCYEVGCNPAAFTDGFSNYVDRINACRNPDQTLVVRITDTCPCVYPANPISNRRWCCGDGNAPHFDLSVNAFEKLADKRVGVIGLRYRQVPCWYQPVNPARRPALYTPENRKPLWAVNPQRGWNWTGDVAGWVEKQRPYPLPPGEYRRIKPTNVTGARATSHDRVPLRIPKGIAHKLKEHMEHI